MPGCGRAAAAGPVPASVRTVKAEYQVRDRLSFMRFLGLGLSDRVPDRTTIWLFREALVRTGAMEGLFARFDAALKERGYFALGG